MKINLQTRLWPNSYNPVMSIKEQREEKEKEAQKQAEKRAEQELYESLGKIKSFAIGTTPNFTIDLNEDMLKLEDIEQLMVTFGQFGKLVQREILYFGDNYDVDYEVDERGRYIPLSAEAKIDDPLIFDDNIHFEKTPFWDYDSEAEKWHDLRKWRHHYQTIRNPKFTYNKIFNTLTLTLSQDDTLRHFKPTNWNYNKDDPEHDLDTPYWQGNDSLVMIEVKIRVRRQLDYHLDPQVIIKPQEYYAVAKTIEYSLARGDKPGPIDYIDEVRKTRADHIHVPHRFRLFFDDYVTDKSISPLPKRTDELHHSLQIAKEILLRDGLRLISRPRYGYKEVSLGDHTFVKRFEKSRYFCFMIPLNIRVKVKSIKCVFGGTPGIMDRVDHASEGDYPPDEYVNRLFKIKKIKYMHDSEGNLIFDEDGRPIYEMEYKDGKPIGPKYERDSEGNIIEITDPRFLEGIALPRPSYNRDETCYFQSTYVIDPSRRTPDNPTGEFICWYICARDPITNQIGRILGPNMFMDDQEPYYEFYIRFEEIGKASLY